MPRQAVAHPSSSVPVPNDVHQHVRTLFGTCNARTSEKLTNAPNIPEQSLDLTWIEHFSTYAVPVRLTSGWSVIVRTHYLGGMRHFRNWEIADIGLLLFIRRRDGSTQSKVALLQSKRLYPTNHNVAEETRSDYEIGFARLADPEDLARSIALATNYSFDDACQYGALIAGSEQVDAIRGYELSSTLRVYYQLYNPWRVPLSVNIPLAAYQRFDGLPELGTRIVTASDLHDRLAPEADGYRPSLRDLSSLLPSYGWRLEEFASDLFLGCSEGTPFDTLDEDRIQSMFYRRSGAISAAVSFVIEEGEGRRE